MKYTWLCVFAGIILLLIPFLVLFTIPKNPPETTKVDGEYVFITDLPPAHKVAIQAEFRRINISTIIAVSAVCCLFSFLAFCLAYTEYKDYKKEIVK